MRKMPVLTMVCLLAVCGLMAAPVYSATVVANEPPDLVLGKGEKVSFDLADFFSSADSDLTYSAVGGTVSGSMVDVNGSSTAGATTATFSAGGVSLESTVQVSDFLIGNAPKVDDNNRIAGMDGGNVFYNPLVAGGTIASKVNLSNLPAVGGAGTPGGATGAAGLAATVASVNMQVANTGLRQVSRAIASGSGLTPTLNANGSYSIAASNTFKGTWLVTLGASDGTSKDAVHLLAAEAVAVPVASLTELVPGSYANGTFTVAAGQSSLAYGAAVTVPAGSAVTLTLDYNASADCAIAAVLFDGALGQILAHANPSGANIQTGKVKSLSMSMVSLTGTVYPAVQVASKGAAVTVAISNVAVVKAGPVVDYALDPNATVYKNDLATVTGWGSDILGTGAKAPTASTDNNFAAKAGAGSMSLAGTGGIANAFVSVALPKGTAVAECYAKAVSGTGTFALVLTDGGALSCETFSALSSSWSKVIAVGTLGASANAFLVVQAAGFDVLVDDVCVRVVKDADAFADLSLLGL